MRTEGFRRGLISVSLISALVISMAFTATPVLAPAVISEPGGTTIEVKPGQVFTLRFRLRWDIPGELGYFSLGIYWDCPENNPSENFTLENAAAYFDLDNDNLPDPGLDPIDITVDHYEKPMGTGTRYAIVVHHDAGDPRDGEFNVDLRMRASGAGGVPHAPTDNHPIVIVGTIDVPEGATWYSYSPPNPYITVRVLALPLSISPIYQSGPPGSTLEYTVTVTNKGAYADTYELTVSDNENWGPSLSENLFENVAPGENRQTTLSVIIPENAVPCTEDNITVTATSQENAQISYSASCIAHVVSELMAIIEGKNTAYNINFTGPPPWVWYDSNPPILDAGKAGDGAIVAGGTVSTCRNMRWNVGEWDVFLDISFQWMVPGATDVLWYEGYNVYNDTLQCSDLIAALKGFGYSVTGDDTEPITSSLLSPYDILVIPQLQLGDMYTGGDPSLLPDADVAAIVNFVEAGGGLLIMEGTDFFGYNFSRVQNKILQAFDFDLIFQDDSVYDDINNQGNPWYPWCDVDTTTEIGGAYESVTGKNEIGLYSASSLAPPPPVFTGDHLKIGITEFGELGTAGVGVGFQYPVGDNYESVAVGWWGDGYLIAYDNEICTHYPHGPIVGTLISVSENTITDTPDIAEHEVVVVTGDGNLKLTFLFHFQKHTKFVIVKATITNISDENLSDVYYKRVTDWDVWSPLGWWGAANWWGWDENYDLGVAFLTPAETGVEYVYMGTAGYPPPTGYDLNAWDDLTIRGFGGHRDTTPITSPVWEDYNLALHWSLGDLSPDEAVAAYAIYTAADTLSELRANVDNAFYKIITRPGVSVSISPSENEGPVGGKVTFTATVTNTGNIQDNYDLTISDNSGWALTLSEDSLENVQPGENRQVTIIVTIPENTAPCTEDNITITAISQTDPTVSDSADCVAHATEKEEWDAFIIATFSGGSDDAFFSVRLDATSGFDNAYDIPEPPPPVTPPYVRTFFYYPGQTPDELHRSCLAPENLMEWPLRIEYADNIEDITLMWSVENIPSKYFVFLHRGENLVVDMRTEDNYTFEASTGSYDFRIVVGKLLPFTLELTQGWNMISLPVLPEDSSPDSIFGSYYVMYGWDAENKRYVIHADSGSYIEPDPDVEVGVGYWAYVLENENVDLLGVPVSQLTLSLRQGWNLIGSPYGGSSIADPVDNPDNSVLPWAFTWDSLEKSYNMRQLLEAGKGYWAHALQDCTLTI